MAHYNLTEFLLYLLLTRVILESHSESLETKVDRLSDRLTLLDSKVSLDLISLRQDLQEVRSLASTSAQGGEVSYGDNVTNIWMNWRLNAIFNTTFVISGRWEDDYEGSEIASPRSDVEGAYRPRRRFCSTSNEPQYNKTYKNGIHVDPAKIRSAWESAQSYQSSLCALWVAKNTRTAYAQADRRLR